MQAFRLLLMTVWAAIFFLVGYRIAMPEKVLVTATLDKDNNVLISLNKKVPYKLITDSPKKVEFEVWQR